MTIIFNMENVYLQMILIYIIATYIIDVCFITYITFNKYFEIVPFSKETWINQWLTPYWMSMVE